MPASIATPDPVSVTKEAIVSIGALELLSGNAPFLLQGNSTVWLIESGRVEVFNVPLRNGEPAGAREHFMSIGEGSLLFGMDPESFVCGAGFLVVGAIGTRVRRLALETLQGFCGQEGHAAEIGRLIEQWVETVSLAVSQEIIPRPISDLQIEQAGAGGEDDGALELQAGGRMKAKKGVVWIESQQVDYLFLGMADVALNGDEALFPLCAETWLETQARAQFRVRGTLRHADDQRLWRGLALFHDSVCQCEFVNKRLLAVDELNRIRAQSHYSHAAKRVALDELVHVLNAPTREYAGTIAGDGLADLTLEVAKLVGAKAGITIRPHPDGKTLTHISNASRFRTRKVALRDDWWNDDQGPLFATLEESGKPVALLPLSPTSYELVNPERGERVKVNAEVAARLQPFATYFYRPFPDGPLTAKSLWQFGRRGLLRDFLRIGFIASLAGMLGTLGPYFTGQIFDWVIPGARRFDLAQFVLGLAASGLTVATFDLVKGIAVQRMEGKMDGSVQAALMDRLLRLPTAFYRNYTSGDLATRAAGIDAVRGVIAGTGLGALLSLISGSYNLILMFWYSMKLGMVAIGLILVAVIFTAVLNLIQLRPQRALLAVEGKIAGLVFQFVSGVAKLRVSGSEDRAFRVWAQSFAEQRRISYKVGTIGNISQVFNSVFSTITSMVLFWCLVFWLMPAKETSITPGTFIAFSGAFGVVLQAALGLSGASLSMLSIIPLFERLKPIIVAPAEVDEAKSFPGQLSGAIEISHVSFRYRPDGPLVLNDISLSIKPGEFIALAGASGSGKSTLLRLLLGFEKPETGSISYDGQDLAKLDVNAMRHQMGIVLQQSSIMPGDIFRNIVGMNESGTIEEAWEAARMAGIDADIRQMPMEMHTVIGQGGSTFSGGQRQRLMIARAIFGKPRILFFDEATSALDNRTQKIVTDSLDRLQATRIVVAHRLSTIVNADRIIVVDKGKIAQQGSYEALMKEEGPFMELAKRQIA